MNNKITWFKRTVIGATLLALSIHGGANTSFEKFEQEFFQKFAQCDLSFFQWLKQHQQHFSNHVSLIEKGNLAYFDTPLLDNGFHYVKFKTPITIQGITLTGYHFTRADATDMEFTQDDVNHFNSYYFWGFTTKEPTLQRTIRKLPQFNFTAYQDVRLSNMQMILDTRKSSKWVNQSFAMGVEVKPYQVEKALFIQGNYEPEINCSVQGTISPQLLKRLHPEL